jgi:hypothetical protein
MVNLAGWRLGCAGGLPGHCGVRTVWYFWTVEVGWTWLAKRVSGQLGILATTHNFQPRGTFPSLVPPPARTKHM